VLGEERLSIWIHYTHLAGAERELQKVCRTRRGSHRIAIHIQSRIRHCCKTNASEYRPNPIPRSRFPEIFAESRIKRAVASAYCKKIAGLAFSRSSAKLVAVGTDMIVVAGYAGVLTLDDNRAQGRGGKKGTPICS